MATVINPIPPTRNRVSPNRPQQGVAGRTIRGLLSIALLCCSVAQLHSAQADDKPARGISDPGVVTTRQNITPAGVQTVFRGRVYGVTFGSTPSEIWALLGRVPQRKAHQVCRLDWQNNRLLGSSWIEGYAEPGLQGIVYDRMSSRVFVGATAGGSSSSAFKNLVRLLSFPEQGDPSGSEDLGRWNCGAPAIASKRNGSGQRIAVVPLIANNELAIVDVETMKLAGKVKTGVAPFGAGINADGSVAYVTNWGGRTPSPQDLTATTGIAPNADRVVVDERGIAATGSVTRIDLVNLRVTDTIPVELHPTAVVLDEARNALYVANTNSDSVSRIDTARNTVTHTIPLQPFRQKVNGVAPTALAISEDGTRLYVACGGINAVAVIDSSNIEVEGPAVANRNWEILGMIPTAFYPNGLSLSRDGEFLAVSTLLGVGLGKLEQPDKGMYSFHRGTVHVVQLPDEGQLASYTTAVAENNHLLLPDPALPAGPPPALLKAEKTAIPRRAGEPSLIEHVVYIIKENLTYDQLFGDLPKGNGDPSRLTYGADIAPNHRQLAQQFVLLDNIYSNGGNSGDGHQWLTQANETAYCWWPGYRGRGYPYDGSDPLAPARAGFIWDLALMMKKSVRVYGEYVARYPLPSLDRKRLLDEWTAGTDFSGRWQVRSPIRRLDSVLARNYPPFLMDVPDVVRAQIFLSDLKQWDRDGTMPNLVILQLPCDHGYGTKPGVTTPAATMADNDLALGQIVEALTKTRFWRKLAIFVIQDDPGGGLDHVDGYRTAAQIISPYARRGTVDSTFYSQVSVLKTIELILGLPTLSLYDMIANDFRNSFTNKPDFTGYTAVVPKQDLSEVNPPLKALKGPALKAAVDSMKMKFDVPDAIPQDRLSRIVWHSIRGWNTPYPSVKRALFTPGSLNLEDDEREEAER